MRLLKLDTIGIAKPAIFPEGIKLQMKVGKIDDCLKKRLIAINNLYIYGFYNNQFFHVLICQ